MLLYYVRHGDPIYNPDSLTPLGQRQAEAIGRRLAAIGMDEVYASTSERAKETARPLCEMTGLSLSELDFANEAHAWREMTLVYPDGSRHWLFLSREACMKMISPEVFDLGQRWFDHPDFAGKGYDAGIARIHRETDAWLLGLGYEHDRERRLYRAIRPNKKKVALFAHEGFGSLFLSSLLDLPYSHFAPYYSMMHTGLTVIDFPEEEGACIPHLRTFSNEGHLYDARIPGAQDLGKKYTSMQ